MRRTPFKGNIVVSNLPDEFTSGDLAALFDEYGLVLGAMIKQWHGDTGRAPRGLVDLAPANAVEEAIRSLNGQVVKSRHLKVRKAPDPPKRAPKPAGYVAEPRAANPAEPRRERPAAGPRTLSVAHVGDRDQMGAPPRPARTPIVERRPLGRRTFGTGRYWDLTNNDPE
jgi:RNA recognition motif-containing protein